MGRWEQFFFLPLVLLDAPHVSIKTIQWSRSSNALAGPSVVLILGQMKRWGVSWMCVWQSGHEGEGWDKGKILLRYERMKGDLFDLSWARVRRVWWSKKVSDSWMGGGCLLKILLWVDDMKSWTNFVCIVFMLFFICVWEVVWVEEGMFRV